MMSIDGNGMLPIDKIADAMRASGLNPTQEQSQMFLRERADPHSSSISLEEFKEMCNTQRDNEAMSGHREKRQFIESVKFALRAFDRDNSGMIHRDELKGGT